MWLLLKNRERKFVIPFCEDCCWTVYRPVANCICFKFLLLIKFFFGGGWWDGVGWTCISMIVLQRGGASVAKYPRLAKGHI